MGQGCTGGQERVRCRECGESAEGQREEGFPGGSVVKNLSAVQQTPVQSLDGEYPLEKKMATHSSILAWEIPWTEEPGGLQSMGSQGVGHD